MSSVSSFFVVFFAIGATLPATFGTNYDVTTLGKLVELSPGVMGHNGSLIVVARGNARGLPLRKDNTFIDESFAGCACCQFWTHDGWSKLDSATALDTKPPLDPQTPIGFNRNSTLANENYDICNGSSHDNVPASVWKLGSAMGHLRSPSMSTADASCTPATQDRVCVSIVARISPGSRISMAMQHSGGPARFQMGVLSIGPEEKTRWLIKRLVKDIPKPLKNKPLDIVLTATQPKGNPDPVMIQWVAPCNPDGDADVYTVKETARAQSLSSGFNVMARSSVLQPSPVCRNGGLLDVCTSKCWCAPGFSGDMCNQGCGPDAFGADCTGKCSIFFPGQQCGGLLLCGAGGTCDCAPGFRGSQCREMCEPGNYGIRCRESCGKCKDDDSCDPYTGRCDGGCLGSLQPPYCLESSTLV